VPAVPVLDDHMMNYTTQDPGHVIVDLDEVKHWRSLQHGSPNTSPGYGKWFTICKIGRYGDPFVEGTIYELPSSHVTCLYCLSGETQ
jgi:hypothetical protein